MANPMVAVLAPASALAMVLTTKPVRAMASSTRRSVSGLIALVWFTTCETVETDTPASRATSAIVVIDPSLCGNGLEPRIGIGPNGRKYCASVCASACMCEYSGVVIQATGLISSRRSQCASACLTRTAVGAVGELRGADRERPWCDRRSSGGPKAPSLGRRPYGAWSSRVGDAIAMGGLDSFVIKLVVEPALPRVSTLLLTK